MKKKSLLLILLMALLAPWAAKADGTLTVHDGSATNGYVPVEGYWADNYLKCEIVYPASELSDMNGQNILNMTWYLTSPAPAAWTGTFQIFMKEVAETSISAYSGTEGATVVYEGTLDGTASTMLVEFDTPYAYSGGNLLIGVYQTAKGNWKSATFAGETVDGASVQGHNSSSLASVSANQRNFIPKTTFSYGAPPTCFKPQNLHATLTPGDGTVATLTWERNASGTEDAWVLQYGTNSTFAAESYTEVEVTGGTPSYHITGLTAETTYYARVKPDCDSEGTKWSDVCSFIPTPKTVIGSGDATHSYLPTNTYYNYSISQQIYTNTELGDAGYIESIDFYCSGSVTRSLDIYMMHTDKNTFSGATDWITVSSGDMVFSGSVAFTAGAWKTIELNSGFNYNGTQNVAIVVVDNTGSYVSAPSFKVFSATSQAIYNFNDDDPYDPTSTISVSGSVLNVKNQIRILKGAVPTCFPPTGLTIGEVTNHTAALSWTPAEGQTAWHVYYSTSNVAPADDIALNKVIEVETTPAHTLTSLDAETTYYVWVRGNCGVDDYSSWNGPQNLTTEVACAEPTALTVSNIASQTATISWTSEAGDFNVKYSVLPNDVTEHKYDNGTYSNSVNAGGDSFFWGIMFPANTFTDNHIRKISVYDANPNNSGFLFICDGSATEPESVLHRSDVALTGSAEFVDIAVDVTFDNTKAVWVLMYTPYAPGCAKTDDPNGRWVSLDGSTWEDITTYSLNYTWMLRAYVDDATEYSWTNKTSTTNSYNLTSLTPESDYIVLVQSVCGGIDGNSTWTGNFFSTLSNCPTPTGLTASNITQNTALLSWTGSSDVDDYTVQFRTSAKINTTDPVFSETFNESSIPTGWENKSGLLSSVMGGTALTTGGNWYFGNSNGAFNSHAYNNIYGTSKKDWLITPSITVGSKNALSFDMALTAYSGTLGAPATTGTDDKFVVLISTDDEATWTILRQWDNAGSPYIYNDIVCSATGENVLIDLSAYNGETVRIAFYGESTVYNADNDLHIDNVIVNTFTDPGTWQTAIDDVEEESFTLTGLTAETKYDAQVKSNCTSGVYCDFISFTTLAEHNIVFPETGNWTASGFEPDGAPTIEDDVIIRANVTIQNGTNAQANNINLENGAVITVASGATLTINGNVTNGGNDKIIVEDGGQLIVKKTGIYATVKKSVAHAKGVGGWYTIASPLYYSTAAASITNMIQTPANNYDLYYYQESTRLWKNYKVSSFSIYKGTGYLYWNSTGAELAFPGSMNYGNVSVTLTKNVAEPTDNLEGFNLIGNPYPHNIYKGAGTAIENSVAEGYVLATGFYTLSNDGTWQAGEDNTTAIKPAQGILVQATTAGTLTIQDKTASGAAKANNDNIKFNVANSQFEDVTYALFMDEIGLTKINHRNDQAPMIYIPQDGENYAIATMGDDTETFGLNFKAMTTGMYTLSAKADGNYSYLHVIDRLTGEDIDMLVDGKYEFIGSPRDNEARFIVKLSYNANGFDNDEFIYQNGDELIVNGEGELQVYDVMGRYVACYNVNGNKRISAEQFSNAVYIFRLVGSDVKTQKIVVR